MLPGLIAALIFAVVAAVAAAVLWTQRNALAEDRADLEAANESHLAKLDARQSEISDLTSRIARHEAQAEALEKSFADAQQQARETFKALAGDTLKDSSKQFLERAGEKLQPMHKLLDEYRKLLREIEDKRSKAYAQLSEQVGSLHTAQKDLRTETANLVRALRRPEGRGRWGELQMERLFELAGMTERVDYDAQASVDGGRLRPDYTVRLPNDRVIVIDVKTPLDAYIDATEATEDSDRQAKLDRHTRQVRDMAAKLSQKEYWAACDGSPEFVVMFIRVESALHAAVQRDPELIERAMEKQVIIATPTLLMALLKTIALGWREQAVSDNAAKISEAGRELYDRIRVMLEHVARMGGAIDKTNEHYNKLVGSIERSVLPQARRFEQLEADGPKKAPEALPPIETNPRTLDAPEAAAEQGE
jgi:DNA recombination protein RmuC